MSPDLASERSAVVATYSNRRDAEMAVDRLEGEGLEAFLSADDAGGMHPHLQETHGVRVLVLEKDVSEALTVLEEAGLLPESGTTEGRGAGRGTADRARSARGGGSRSRRRSEDGGYPITVTGGAFVVILIVIVLALLVLTLMPG